MATKRNFNRVLYLYGFSNFDGVNTKTDRTLIADNQARAIKNIDFKRTGEISKRPGYAKWGTAIEGVSSINSMYCYIYKAGASRKLIATAGTDVYTYDTVTQTFNSISSGYTANQKFNFITFQDKCIWVNGKETAKKYDGTTVSDLGGNPPICKYIKLHKNYVFMAGNTDYPSRLYYSKLDNPEAWYPTEGAGFFDVNTDDNDFITGLDILNDTLVIYKNRKTYILYGDSPTYVAGLTLWRIKETSASHGCVGQGSIVKIGDSLFAFSRNDGVVKLFNDDTTTEIAMKDTVMAYDVSPEFRALNQAMLGLSEAIYWDYKYILSVPYGASTKNNFNFVYDGIKNAWTYWDIPANCWCIWDSGTQEYLLFGSTSSGQVYYLAPNIYSDDGNPIEAYYRTKDVCKIQDVDMPSNDKIYEYFYLTKNQATDFTVTVKYFIDLVDTPRAIEYIGSVASDSLWGTMIWGVNKWGSATTTTGKKRMNSRGKFISFEFYNNTLGEDMRIRNLTFYYKPRNIR